MKKILLFIFSLCLLTEGYSQVGINILIPDSSAVLQLESNKKGLGLSRLNSAQMNGIVNPLKGLTIFNTTDSVVEYWNGECWLKAWEKNCYYCDFQMTINHFADTLDRVNADSVFATITVRHIHGTGPISANWTAVPPTGVQIYQQGSNTIDTSGSFNIVVKADIFAGSGNVPILITAYCGDQVRFVTYNVYIKPCVIVDLQTDVTNYDVQGQNSTVLPAGSRQCVLVNVFAGVTVHSANATLPALTVGNLNPLSIVGFMNVGAILGRGGDGGSISSTTSTGNPGQNGGNALNLTTRTILRNSGEIYGGGGGGGSAGISYTSPNIPVINRTLSIGYAVGGGGGSESGAGGAIPSGSINIGAYQAGTAATPTAASVPGQGGTETTPLPITISVVTLTLTPNVIGGDGGGFAQAGTAGSASLGIKIVVSVPIVGSITLVNTNVSIPNGGAGGAPGLAIERNGNPLQGIADGYYNSLQVKGVVAP